MPDMLYPNTPLGMSMMAAHDTDLGSYFLSLPDEVKEAINQNAAQIHSADDMKRIAQEFMDKSAEHHNDR
ncbi:MAG: hypothetical protein U0I48_05400 [Acutalibacteraceae bacterium]|jgi:hypothetical protein|nr:hypothetical protein [Acutalibacteraceae bacterium]